MGSRPRGDCALLGDDRFACAGANHLPRYRTHEPWHGLPGPGITLEELVFGLGLVPAARWGVQPQPRTDVGRDHQQNSGWGRGLYHTICRVGATPSSLFFSNGLRFVSTVIRLGPQALRALLQVYDTEGTASSSPDVLVRLWVASRR